MTAVALALTAFLGRPTDALELTAVEKANARVVTDFCAAAATRDVEKMLPFLATDVVYRMTETTPPITGKDAVAAAIRKFLQSAERVEFKVLDTTATGPIVINHRIDSFVSKQPVKWEGTGVFFVKDGTIKEWSDYTIRMER